MHMAAALGVPVIALFGPTSPLHWRPCGHQATIMYQGLECSPCLRLGFESRCRRNRCLDLLTPEVVIGEISRSGL